MQAQFQAKSNRLAECKKNPRFFDHSFYLSESVGPNILAIFDNNIAIVAGIILLLGQCAFGRRYAPPLAIVGIISHTFLVGADVAVSRTAFMGGLWVLSIWMCNAV